MTMVSATQDNDLAAAEAEVANLLSLAWQKFAKLQRSDDGRRDFLFHINAAQYLVLAGPGIRQLNAINATNQAALIEEARAQGHHVPEQAFDTSTGQFVDAEQEGGMPAIPPEAVVPAPPAAPRRPRRPQKSEG